MSDTFAPTPDVLGDPPPPIPEEAWAELPIFPLPTTVLLPRTFLSLHVFEPRYRRMMDDVSDGYRVLAVSTLDESGTPDYLGRPPVHAVMGVGVLRRSARLPDGRYNIVVEGAMRGRTLEELTGDVPYRRVRAQPMPDIFPSDARVLEAGVSSVRALAARIVAQMASADPEIMRRLNGVGEPGALADLIAAAALQDHLDRQKILEEPDIMRRLNLAGAGLAQLLLRADDMQSAPTTFGWGIGPGKA